MSNVFSRFWTNHSKQIVLTTAVAGVISSTALAVRAGYRAHDILVEEGLDEAAPWPDKIRATWREFIPSAISLCASVGSMVYLHKLNQREAAALASAAAISNAMYNEFVAKIEEKLDPEVVQSIRDDIAQDHADEDPDETFVLSDDQSLFRDGFSGRYFVSTKNEVDSSVNQLNKEIIDCGYASLTDFYELIGLSQTTVSDTVGWNTDSLLEISYANIETSGGYPAKEIVFHCNPDVRFSQPF